MHDAKEQNMTFYGLTLIMIVYYTDMVGMPIKL